MAKSEAIGKDLDGHAIIVTGGTRGVGLGIVRLLARVGARIMVTGRKLERLQKVSAELESLGAEHLTMQSNVADADACRAMGADPCHLRQPRSPTHARPPARAPAPPPARPPNRPRARPARARPSARSPAHPLTGRSPDRRAPACSPARGQANSYIHILYTESHTGKL